MNTNYNITNTLNITQTPNPHVTEELESLSIEQLIELFEQDEQSFPFFSWFLNQFITQGYHQNLDLEEEFAHRLNFMRNCGITQDLNSPTPQFDVQINEETKRYTDLALVVLQKVKESLPFPPQSDEDYIIFGNYCSTLEVLSLSIYGQSNQDFELTINTLIKLVSDTTAAEMYNSNEFKQILTDSKYIY